MIRKKQQPASDVGVIIGRFQVPEMHDAHVELIQSVIDAHPAKVVIILGRSPLFVSRANPLDWETRKQMILGRFPHVNVLYQKDLPSDSLWSKQIDRLVDDMLCPGQKATLYGGRDSFLKCYSGKHRTQELESDRYISGTEIRKMAAAKVRTDPAFRAGVIWAAMNQYVKNYSTVDIAIVDKDGTRLLLARKEDEPKYRFIGGFSDPKSPTFEDDARREVAEETGVEAELSYRSYLGSFTVDDWRYRNEDDKIKTLFYKATYVFGRPEPNDDICEVRWFDWVETIYPSQNSCIATGPDPSSMTYAVRREVRDMIVDEHLPLLDRLIDDFRYNHSKFSKETK